jgi:aerobic carbon-monoxide dehydrogenase small subunit
MINTTLRINGQMSQHHLPDETLLVELLREHCHLTGTHVGCDTTQCGACTVHVDGKILKSCTLLVAQIEGSEVTTIEGLAHEDQLHPVQEAFKECHALQCGFCTPGMIMAISHFLKVKPAPLNDEMIIKALEGNICRCTGYVNIIKAFKSAALKMYPDLIISDGELK